MFKGHQHESPKKIQATKVNSTMSIKHQNKKTNLKSTTQGIVSMYPSVKSPDNEWFLPFGRIAQTTDRNLAAYFGEYCRILIRESGIP